MAPASVAPAVADRAIEIRRRIHRLPELGFDEHRTAAVIETELDTLGIPHRRYAGTGVVGIVRGARPGPVAGLRADMDALPLDERSGEPFASEIPNVMHACGHDAHVAMLLGAASVFAAERDGAGTTVLYFQPAEEGPGGALPMIEAGALDDPRPDAMAMLHVDPRLETGTIGFIPGPTNAACDEFRLTIHGRGGHGAAPHGAIDAIPCAAATVLALQNIAARETDPMAAIVVTIGTIEGGYRNNIIADRVHMTGTFRTQHTAIRNALEARARRIVDGVAAAYGARAELEVLYGYPAVVNDPEVVRTFHDLLEAESAMPVLRPPATMGGEDFAYFAERVPSVLVRHGIRSEVAGSTHAAHSAQFRVDEASLVYGIETLVRFSQGVRDGKIFGTARP